MPAHLDLIITAGYPNRTAELRLRDPDGSQLCFRQTEFKNISVSHQQGLFDLRNYLRNYVEAGMEAAAVAEIGVCIAEEVLGKEIFEKLWRSESQRRALALREQLPYPADLAFHPLEQWLRQRQVDLVDLQAAVDQFLEQPRQAALAPPKP